MNHECPPYRRPLGTTALRAMCVGLSLILALLVFTGCYSEGDSTSPTEMPGICAPPDTVGARVTASGCSAQADGTVQCRAAYTVPSAGTNRVAWSFTGPCSPLESSNPAGEFSCTFLEPLPQSVAFEATRCTCSSADDPAGNSCRSTSGTVTFN